MNQQHVYVFAKWQAKEGNAATVLQHLAAVAKETVKEEGNLFYKVHQSNTDANTIMLYEGYTSQQAVDAHRNAAYFQNIVIGQIVPLLQSREVVVASELIL